MLDKIHNKATEFTDLTSDLKQEVSSSGLIKKSDLKVAFFIVFIVLVSFISSKIYEYKTEEFKNKIFYELNDSVKKEVELLISEKKNASMLSVLSLSKNFDISNAILGMDTSLDLKALSLELRSYTNFKDVWFMLIDVDGNVVKRSWIDLKGDNILNSSPYMKSVLKKKTIKSVLDVNKFDLVFNSIVPVERDGKVIGALAVMTHFNSIAKQLSKDGFRPVVFLNSKNSSKLNINNSFCDIFIGDCYIANTNADKLSIKIIHDRGLEYYINSSSDYHIHSDTNTFETLYPFYNEQGSRIGSIIIMKSLDEIDMGDLELFQGLHISVTIFFIIVVWILGYYVRTSNYVAQIKKDNEQLFKLNTSLNEKNDELDFNEKKIANIFHIQPSIMVISNGITIETVNEKFLNFFSQYDSLEEFKKNHDCICDFFEPYDDSEYFNNEYFGDIPWKDYILARPKETFKVVIRKHKSGKLHHFVIKMNEMKYAKFIKRYIVVSFIDITHEIELATAAKEKEEAMLEQSKMAQMGEMIGFISHQWRQPLGSISLAASGMKFKSDMGLLKDGDISEFSENIIENSKFLSDTIEDFTKFIKEKREVEQVDLRDRIELVLKIINTTYKSNNILVKKQISEEELPKTLILGELSQGLMNILSNAKDELVKLQKNDSWIEVIAKREGDDCIISIEDNAGGIPEDILPNIFKQYFTTKEEGKGTGLGLYMTKDLIEKNLDGDLSVKNTDNGAMFIIRIPLDIKEDING